MNLRRQFTKRALCALLAVLSLLPIAFTVSADSQADAAAQIADIPDVELADGVYRIRNYATGLYLETYKYSAKGSAKLCVAEASSSEAQCVYIHKAGGGWIMTPQNEKGAYSLSWKNGTQMGAYIGKTQKESEAEYTYFDISKLSNGAFTIAPSGGDNKIAVLAATDERTSSSDYYVCVSDYIQGDASQMWILESVPTERLTVAYRQTTVKLYSTGRFYARKHPYDMVTSDIVWTSSNEDVILIGEDGVWCALAVGEATVTASAGGASVSFTVDVQDKNAFTWYSQNNMYTSDWSGDALEGLFFKAGSTKLRFMSDAKLGSQYSNWMDSGCALASVATVLHNMGAVKTVGYDLRTGQDGYLPADPYTVALANSGNYGVSSVSETMSGNPIYMAWARVASKFEVDGEQVSIKKYYSPSRSKIRDLLKEHPQGVIVCFTRGKKTHYVVFAECLNPEERSSSKLEFLIYDPAAYYPENGDGVIFEDTISYKYEGYRYSSIASVIVYDTVSKIDN